MIKEKATFRTGRVLIRAIRRRGVNKGELEANRGETGKRASKRTTYFDASEAVVDLGNGRRALIRSVPTDWMENGGQIFPSGELAALE